MLQRKAEKKAAKALKKAKKAGTAVMFLLAPPPSGFRTYVPTHTPSPTAFLLYCSYLILKPLRSVTCQRQYEKV